MLSAREEAERRLEETRAEVEIMLADAADQAVAAAGPRHQGQ